MEHNEIKGRIADLEREIAILPEGSITKKRIKDKDYYYHRINRNGKRTESYISFDNLYDLTIQIEKRKTYERELKDLKSQMVAEEVVPYGVRKLPFKTVVRHGKQLESQIELTRKYKKRECISALRDYIFGE